MSFLGTSSASARDPLQAFFAADPGAAVLAVVSAVEGPSYRPLGAMMTILGEDERAGSLSSGCIEADISRHARDAASSGQPQLLRYGRGSPYLDLRLPCGGGLEVILLPRPSREILGHVIAQRARRQPSSFAIDVETGNLSFAGRAPTGRSGQVVTVRIDPPLRFLIFGKGPEAGTFAAMVQSAGYPNLLISPDAETLETAGRIGCLTRRLASPEFPPDVPVDDRTAVVLFFHDHEWEPVILSHALAGPAFYIGAQGSMRARDARLQILARMGISDTGCERMRGPIGLIPSARDPATLAVSVLAEILAEAMVSAP